MEKPSQVDKDSNQSSATQPDHVMDSNKAGYPGTFPKKPIQLGIVQSSSGGRSFSSTISKKSRWDQGPGPADDEGDVKNPDIESKQSEKNSESVKSIIKKFEDISSSTGSVSDVKKAGDGGATIQSPSRVKLVRTNFTKSSKPVAVVGSSLESKKSESVEKLTKDESPQVSKPVVANSKALQIISSNYDSPTDESSQEGDLSEGGEIIPGDSAYASFEKLNLGEISSNTQSTDVFTANVAKHTDDSVTPQSINNEFIIKEIKKIDVKSNPTLEQIMDKAKLDEITTEHNISKIDSSKIIQEESKCPLDSPKPHESFVDASKKFTEKLNIGIKSTSPVSEPNKLKGLLALNESITPKKDLYKPGQEQSISQGLPDPGKDDSTAAYDTKLKPVTSDELDTTMEQMFSDNFGPDESVSSSDKLILTSEQSSSLTTESNIEPTTPTKQTDTVKQSVEEKEKLDNFESNASLLEMLEEGNSVKKAYSIDDKSVSRAFSNTELLDRKNKHNAAGLNVSEINAKKDAELLEKPPNIIEEGSFSGNKNVPVVSISGSVKNVGELLPSKIDCNTNICHNIEKKANRETALDKKDELKEVSSKTCIKEGALPIKHQEDKKVAIADIKLTNLQSSTKIEPTCNIAYVSKHSEGHINSGEEKSNIIPKGIDSRTNQNINKEVEVKIPAADIDDKKVQSNLIAEKTLSPHIDESRSSIISDQVHTPLGIKIKQIKEVIDSDVCLKEISPIADRQKVEHKPEEASKKEGVKNKVTSANLDIKTNELHSSSKDKQQLSSIIETDDSTINQKPSNVSIKAPLLTEMKTKEDDKDSKCNTVTVDNVQGKRQDSDSSDKKLLSPPIISHMRESDSKVQKDTETNDGKNEQPLLTVSKSKLDAVDVKISNIADKANLTTRMQIKGSNIQHTEKSIPQTSDLSNVTLKHAEGIIKPQISPITKNQTSAIVGKTSNVSVKETSLLTIKTTDGTDNLVKSIPVTSDIQNVTSKPDGATSKPHLSPISKSQTLEIDVKSSNVSINETPSPSIKCKEGNDTAVTDKSISPTSDARKVTLKPDEATSNQQILPITKIHTTAIGVDSSNISYKEIPTTIIKAKEGNYKDICDKSTIPTSDLQKNTQKLDEVKNIQLLAPISKSYTAEIGVKTTNIPMTESQSPTTNTKEGNARKHVDKSAVNEQTTSKSLLSPGIKIDRAMVDEKTNNLPAKQTLPSTIKSQEEKNREAMDKSISLKSDAKNVSLKPDEVTSKQTALTTDKSQTAQVNETSSSESSVSKIKIAAVVVKTSNVKENPSLTITNKVGDDKEITVRPTGEHLSPVSQIQTAEISVKPRNASVKETPTPSIIETEEGNDKDITDKPIISKSYDQNKTETGGTINEQLPPISKIEKAGIDLKTSNVTVKKTPLPTMKTKEGNDDAVKSISSSPDVLKFTLKPGEVTSKQVLPITKPQKTPVGEKTSDPSSISKSHTAGMDVKTSILPVKETPSPSIKTKEGSGNADKSIPPTSDKHNVTLKHDEATTKPQISPVGKSQTIDVKASIVPDKQSPSPTVKSEEGNDRQNVDESTFPASVYQSVTLKSDEETSKHVLSINKIQNIPGDVKNSNVCVTETLSPTIKFEEGGNKEEIVDKPISATFDKKNILKPADAKIVMAEIDIKTSNVSVKEAPSPNIKTKEGNEKEITDKPIITKSDNEKNLLKSGEATNQQKVSLISKSQPPGTDVNTGNMSIRESPLFPNKIERKNEKTNIPFDDNLSPTINTKEGTGSENKDKSISTISGLKRDTVKHSETSKQLLVPINKIETSAKNVKTPNLSVTPSSSPTIETQEGIDKQNVDKSICIESNIKKDTVKPCETTSKPLLLPISKTDITGMNVQTSDVSGNTTPLPTIKTQEGIDRQNMDRSIPTVFDLKKDSLKPGDKCKQQLSPISKIDTAATVFKTSNTPVKHTPSSTIQFQEGNNKDSTDKSISLTSDVQKDNQKPCDATSKQQLPQMKATNMPVKESKSPAIEIKGECKRDDNKMSTTSEVTKSSHKLDDSLWFTNKPLSPVSKSQIAAVDLKKIGVSINQPSPSVIDAKEAQDKIDKTISATSTVQKDVKKPSVATCKPLSPIYKKQTVVIDVETSCSSPRAIPLPNKTREAKDVDNVGKLIPSTSDIQKDNQKPADGKTNLISENPEESNVSCNEPQSSDTETVQPKQEGLDILTSAGIEKDEQSVNTEKSLPVSGSQALMLDNHNNDVPVKECTSSEVTTKKVQDIDKKDNTFSKATSVPKQTPQSGEPSNKDIGSTISVDTVTKLSPVDKRLATPSPKASKVTIEDYPVTEIKSKSEHLPEKVTEKTITETIIETSDNKEILPVTEGSENKSNLTDKKHANILKESLPTDFKASDKNPLLTISSGIKTTIDDSNIIEDKKEDKDTSSVHMQKSKQPPSSLSSNVEKSPAKIIQDVKVDVEEVTVEDNQLLSTDITIETIENDPSPSTVVKEAELTVEESEEKKDLPINKSPAAKTYQSSDAATKPLTFIQDRGDNLNNENTNISIENVLDNENAQEKVNRSENHPKANKRPISDYPESSNPNFEKDTPSNKRSRKSENLDTETVMEEVEEDKQPKQETIKEGISSEPSEAKLPTGESQTQKVSPTVKPKVVPVKEVPAPVRVSARQKQRQAAAAAALAAEEQTKSLKQTMDSSSKKTLLDKNAEKRGKKSVSPTEELYVKIPCVKSPEQGLQSPSQVSKFQKSLSVSPKKSVKELGQDKLEPITLKLSKEENPVIVRSSSLSPKKVLSPSSPQTKTLGYTLKIGKDSTTIIPKDPTHSPRDRDSSPGNSNKGELSGKIGYLIKDTGLTITPVAQAETQEQKLNKITLKLSKAGGHPEIKQEKGETWKAIKKLGEIDIVPVEGKSCDDDLKRKDKSDHGSPEKKLKISEVIAEPSTSMSKLQGLLTQAPLNQSDDSEDLQFVGFSSPREQSPNQQFTYDIGLVKQEPEPQVMPKKRGRPRKIPSSDLMHQVSHTLPQGLTAKDILAASLQHQTLQHFQQLHQPMHLMPEPPQEPECSQPMFPVPLFDLSEDTFMEPSPPTVFPDQVQPTNILRSARGRPIGRSRRPRGSGLLRAAERGGPRGRPRGSRGIKRMLEEMEALSYPDMEEPITLDNIDSQMGPRIIEPTGSQIAVSTMALLRKSIEGKREFAEKKARRSDGSDSDQADLEAKVKEMKEKIEAAYKAELNSPKTSPEKESKKRTPDKGESSRKGPPELIPLTKKTPEKRLSDSKRKSSDENVEHFHGIGMEFAKRKSTEEKSENKDQDNMISRRVSATEGDVMEVDATPSEKDIKTETPEVVEPEVPPKPVRPRPKSKAEIKRIKREKDRLRREAKKLAALEALKAPPPNPSEEDTRMSASDPNAEGLDDSFGIGIKKNRMEVGDPEGKEFTVEQIAEYQWPLQGGELYMVQEQISTYLGVKSFKRKYPDLKRRTVEMEEKTFLLESGLVSESMCDLGLTAVCSSEVLDVMFQDFQEQYEELRKHMREKAARELINKQKERKKFEQSLSKSDLKEHAIQSALNWNQALNRGRTEGRRCHLDLQTWTVQYPRGRPAPRPRPRPGHYPVALIPGQYSDYYKRYTPQELRYWPVNTVLYGPLQPNERNGPAGSEGSQSDSEESSSSDDSSESSSDGEASADEREDCKLCGGSGGGVSGARRSGAGMLQCSQCGHHIHVSCAELNPAMLAEVRKYAWQCSACKTCQRCNKAKNESKMLFCDSCDRGYHIYCVGLRRVPAGSWTCNSCLSDGGES